MSKDRAPVGLVLGSVLPPEDIPHVARRGEELGFGELWLAEDYFFTGGISGATAVLAQTKEVPVGLGIVSAMVRHPAVLAMEISTMARMYPGRVFPGVGLGVPAWIEQMGLTPPSQLAAMRECVGSVRRLLDGEELTESGKSFDFVNVKLTHPVSERVPLYMGVVGPKMLKVSGEIADGTVISVLAGVDYVRWAQEQIDAGRSAVGRTDPHRIVTFAMFAVDNDGKAAKDRLRGIMGFYLAAMARSSLTEVYGIADELVDLAEAGGPARVADAMAADWIDDLAVAGTPDECAERIKALLAAGSDSVILFPVPAEEATSVIEVAASEVLSRL
jgi:alkanesulfonate monooxygenase SsuD/methylene tetrahydromethanopterin reductase-like flavin-dependent oxidoreductase (luciferase family)